jgi:hypothetical protein
MYNVLYLGSGNSAKLIDKLNLDNYFIVGVNNTWRLFKDSRFDIWIHSGDFPVENRPKLKNYDAEISYNEYSKSASSIVEKLGIKCNSPQHYLGYTIFFMGLYWIMNDLQPSKISLLGFDHDYNPDKVDKWNNHNRPNPQNSYLKPRGQSIKDWSNDFFKDMKHDSFYGHGTPDPIRLGMQHLIQKMRQAVEYSDFFGIEILNLSPVCSEFNNCMKK